MPRSSTRAGAHTTWPRSLLVRQLPPGAQRLVECAQPGDGAALANAGCLLYRDGDYAGAARRFEDAVHALGRQVSGQRMRGCARH